MYHQTRLKLTTLYSVIFTLLFCAVTFGIYFWMNQYFGDTHAPLYQRAIAGDETKATGELQSDIVMDHLRTIIVFLDTGLFLAVPLITWFLTGKTLKPIQTAHERERELFTNASHDLRTPLTILRGELDIALRKDRTAENYKKILESSREEVIELISLTETMLFFSRMTELSDKEQDELIDITDMALTSIHAFKHQAEEKHLTLLFQPAKESLVIKGNKQLLKRMFTNILDNAIKYTNSGSVLIRLRKEDGEVKILIQDTGTGISKEEQGKLFDRFYRTQASYYKTGYGIGLAIVRRIVEYHHGTIHLSSAIGNGTTITIHFPVAMQAPQRNLS